jgi:isopentenyl phosphate kinase
MIEMGYRKLTMQIALENLIDLILQPLQNTKNKTLLITGGTGSFSHAVLNRFFTNRSFSEIQFFLVMRKKQDDMRNQLKSDKLKFYIGDVHDYAVLTCHAWSRLCVSCSRIKSNYLLVIFPDGSCENQCHGDAKR